MGITLQVQMKVDTLTCLIANSKSGFAYGNNYSDADQIGLQLRSTRKYLNKTRCTLCLTKWTVNNYLIT